jgi:hypothetical protein
MASTVKTSSSDSWEKATSGGPSSYLPDEAEDKIQYAFRMILEAHRGKAMTSETEIRSLRQTMEELKIANANLTKKYAAAEREIMEQQHRNQVLTKDNESLAIANRQLMQRCDKYKRIQQTFSEALENSGHEDDLVVNPTSISQTSILSGEYRPAFASLSSSGTTPTPAVSLVVAAPPLASMSPKTSGGQQEKPAASSNSFDSNGKDGKQFFRVVRTRLPFESFNAFLSIIKKLNAHEFTREVAVEEAKKIFGSENMDLLGDFQSLISRHISSS